MNAAGRIEKLSVEQPEELCPAVLNARKRTFGQTFGSTMPQTWMRPFAEFGNEIPVISLITVQLERQLPGSSEPVLTLESTICSVSVPL